MQRVPVDWICSWTFRPNATPAAPSTIEILLAIPIDHFGKRWNLEVPLTLALPKDPQPRLTSQSAPAAGISD